MIVITASGGRPEALELLNTYLERQTDQDFEWIITDDCEPTCNVPSRCDQYIVTDWVWSGENTQHRSMARLLKEVSDDDSVVICEDDDWYQDDYIAKCKERLKQSDLVGERESFYFNIRTLTHHIFKNARHSSLCQTACKGEALKRLRQICESGKGAIDIELWKHKGMLFDDRSVVGIKGMAGREGIGVGHRLKERGNDWSELEKLIKEDVKNYRKRFIVCASGGSLTQEDVDYCKGKGTVIVINNTYQLAPWADILFACDTRWWQAYPEALEFKGRKASIRYKHPEVEYWPSENRINGLGEDVIYTGGNSGHQSINLAYLLGASEIILLGFDMQFTDNKAHWHGDHERGLSQQHDFKGWIGHMNVLAGHLKKKGVQVYNCSRQTALECFERKDLEDVC